MTELGLLVGSIARAVVNHPEAVQVEEVQEENTRIIRLQVAPADVGQVIGKQGRIAQAMRTLLIGAAAKLRQRAILEIVEEFVE